MEDTNVWHGRQNGCGDRPGISIELIIDYSKTV